ncbi:MAG: MFS transporter [Hymenobacter sp.]
MQMWGMLLGGILWGVLGDKRGRLSVLFGSILLYSLANIANGFVQTVEQYGWLRLIAGVGLAGELGAGITLVAETPAQGKRGYGTMIVASVGVSGAMVAYLVGQSSLAGATPTSLAAGWGWRCWRCEPACSSRGCSTAPSESDVPRGNFLSLFTNGLALLGKYLRCLLMGAPFWYLVGILITLAPEFGKQFGLQGPVTGGLSIFLVLLRPHAGRLHQRQPEPDLQEPQQARCKCSSSRRPLRWRPTCLPSTGPAPRCSTPCAF